MMKVDYTNLMIIQNLPAEELYQVQFQLQKKNILQGKHLGILQVLGAA